MPITKIFIGSSSAAKSQAKAFISKYNSATLKFLPWWDAFIPGHTLLEDLNSIRNRVEAAVLLFSPESSATIRKQTVQVPNLNVLFEFGYFLGHLGSNKVVILKYGDFYIPSNLGGYIYIKGSKFFKRAAVVPVGKNTDRAFNRWVAQI